ncbi:hypothetical protein A3H65_01195 [Candidatus Giovannonibacteria bacterium RIFCSPLOWO2_02_FULL_45_14]|uniref:HIT domain-containing protein n=1 Tax=Candidatus Giovannonibacteria bacterium RIFCSPLOWO2_12_FULL_44_15 TaxID=1798364 RepID=A0A1F5Y0U2_9BACT|nr:MAG: hypothetical protein A3E62_00765 [Candidatus Giovannonibacteria bacterium RIFCSPHIGHO2_12_FULL_44_29]OGF91070.1 MAG: hypothetical protein A3H65_01195 [Candidatus Giovannonibacteria bacterium RIFCSPLOWO2_02_FULL_45_14]OGF93767.1 MAG: hypothetical protein A3G54_02560 [Candidatus Giovannonibacteria bacterium RIFCSPLOWO2_12_FULL_44_15]
MSEKNEFVNLDNSRNDEQKQVMEKILTEGFCPFCRENLDKSELEPEIRDIDLEYWNVRKNRWPYENTKVHLLIIVNEHAEKISQVKPEAWAELKKIIDWAEEKYKLESGVLGMRFGDPKRNGATVDHLHGHIVTANITDREDPKYRPVRFRMG